MGNIYASDTVPTEVTTAVATAVTGRFLLGRGRDRMSAEECRVLDHAIDDIREVPSRQLLVERGRLVPTSTYLISGYICRYMDDRAGHRQLVALHVPGDFVDLHAFPMKRLDHDVATIGPVRIAVFDHSTLKRIGEEHPHLTRMLWYSTLLDAAMHREWIFRLGRLGAIGRVAHLFCELQYRLEMVGLAPGGRFAIPLTQVDIAEAVGLTGVHVNRTMRKLREDGLLDVRAGTATIPDAKQLARLAEFKPDYLYGDPPAASGDDQ